MTKRSDDQLSFDLPEPQGPARPRSKRLRFRVRRQADRTPGEHEEEQAEEGVADEHPQGERVVGEPRLPCPPVRVQHPGPTRRRRARRRRDPI